MPRERQLELFGAATRPPPRVGPATVSDAARALAARMPADVRLGTSSWSFPGWRGIVWDRDASPALLAREGLAAYARHPLLRTVGLDRTYYAPMTAAALASLAAQVPDDFSFLVKAHEACTLPRFPQRERYGARAGTVNAQFLDPHWASAEVVGPVVDGLGAKAGPIVFQFAPQPRAALGGARFVERLHAFLSALPRGPLYAVELRTAELLDREYALAIADAGACHCYSVHPALPGLPVQVARVPPETAPALVVRWNLGAGLRYDAAVERYQPFDRLVDEDPGARSAIAGLCRRGHPAWVVVNNKAEGSAPLSIARLAEAIAGTG